MTLGAGGWKKLNGATGMRGNKEAPADEEAARLTAIKQEVLSTGLGSRTEVSVAFEG